MLDELFTVQKDRCMSLGMFVNLFWLIRLHCMTEEESVIEELDVTAKVFTSWHANILWWQDFICEPAIRKRIVSLLIIKQELR
uniref:Predicted protein n=1 Tax=Hordeum vulgare subsp. vulgare TaxID=112509 RepID=F2EKE5_HORVV|nr:predicted protein [Hordeum vulgare subsp. vulgare]